MQKLVFKIQLSLVCFCLLALCSSVEAQSFEKMNIDHLTTTPTASRSANFIDVNEDGWDDIFFINGPSSGQNNMLYINNQDGTFLTVMNDDIVMDNDRSDGASFADADNDGDLDALVVTYGKDGVGKKNYFYRNINEGAFDFEEEMAISAILTYSEMANWIDINNDQLLDVYITNSRSALNNLYFENQGDGSFLQRTDLSITNQSLPSRSIDWIDYDNDGDPDLFITNEEGSKNSLFRNDGPNNFTAIDNLTIVQDQRNSAGSSWADVDNDGDFDLFIANYNGEKNQLFINENGNFTEKTNSVIAESGGGSFGSTFGDLDNDGDVDLIVCHAYFTGQTKNSVFINDGMGNFSRDASSALALQEGNSFGAALGDYNNDGWLDVILANTLGENQTNSLFKNTGVGNNWVKILCKGTVSNASAVGAKLKITATIDGIVKTQFRNVATASGYCSQNSFTNHFGLSDATSIDELQITWPSGTVETFNDLDVNTFHSIEEGKGTSNINHPELKTPSISIFPNPSTHAVNFKLEELHQDTALLELFDLKGNRVTNYNFDPSEINTIQKGELPAGEYILKITVSKAVITSKIIFH